MPRALQWAKALSPANLFGEMENKAFQTHLRQLLCKSLLLAQLFGSSEKKVQYPEQFRFNKTNFRGLKYILSYFLDRQYPRDL